MKWPAEYTFNLVLKRTDPSISPVQLQAEMQVVVERVCGAPIDPSRCVITERMGGKYVSLQLPVMLRAPEFIQKVLDEVKDDARVVMKY